jgi:hypothetical protein
MIYVTYIMFLLYIIIPQEFWSSLCPVGIHHVLTQREMEILALEELYNLNPECGEENPGRPGNYCVQSIDHESKVHRDGEDREWQGRDL